MTQEAPVELKMGVVEPSKSTEEVRIASMRIAGWTAGVSAFFGVGTLTAEPSWPAALGVAAVMAAVTVVCCAILKKGQ